MTEKTEILKDEKTLSTLIALDIGFSCLLENIRNTNPALASSLATDMQQTAQRLPLHLPKQAHGAIDTLKNWAAVLNSDPSQQADHQLN